MKYYLAVLLEFFRLKGVELKEWFINGFIWGFIFIISIISLSTIFHFGFDKDILWCKIIACIISGIFIIGILFLLSYLIYYFFKWLKNLIKENWQQAKKNISKSK